MDPYSSLFILPDIGPYTVLLHTLLTTHKLVMNIPGHVAGNLLAENLRCSPKRP